MAEKKKMSTAEILAAARKGTAGAAAQPAPKAAAAEPPEAEAVPAETGTAEVNHDAPAAPPAAKPKPAAAGGKLSVAEILAKARAEKAGGAAATEAAAPAKPAATKAPPQAPAEKPAAKPKPEKVGAAAATAGPAMRDTSSILAAARAAAKPGPMSKSEAAARLKPASPAKPAKGEAIVPPMPAKPDYAKPKPAKAPVATGENRRVFMGVLIGSFLGIGFTAMTLTLSLWTLAFARFMFPNVLTEPPSKFKVGFPSNFPPGVVERSSWRSSACGSVNSEYNGLRQIVRTADRLHAPGLHAELARRRAEIQMPLPRQRVL